MLNLHWHELQLYRNCPQKFWYVHHGLKPKSAKVAPKMLYGSLWHAAYVARRANRAMEPVFDMVADEQGLSPEARLLAADLWAEVVADLEWYEEQTQAMRLKRILWIEEPGEALTLPISATLSICGRPDLVAEIEDEWGGGICAVDHKTHAILHETAQGPRYEPAVRDSTLQRYWHSRQFVFYVGLWNRLHPDQPCETALLNLVPQRVGHVLRFLESRRGKPKLPEVRREPIPYDPTFCERIVNEAIHTAKEIEAKLLAGPDAEPWPQHDHACMDWNEACAFLEVCEASDTSRQLMIESLRESEPT